MKKTASIQSILAGILFAAAVFFNLKMLSGSALSIGSILRIAGYGVLTVALLIRRKNIVIPVGFGIIVLVNLLGGLRLNNLLAIGAWLVAVFISIVYCTKYLPQFEKPAKSLWIVPGILMLISTLLSVIPLFTTEGWVSVAPTLIPNLIVILGLLLSMRWLIVGTSSTSRPLVGLAQFAIKNALFMIAFAGLVAYVSYLFIADKMDVLHMIIAIALCFAVLQLRAVTAGKEITAANELLKDHISFNERDKTLTVKKRDAKIAKVLGIQPYTRTEYGYTPEKLVYTAVTVGGITTGGVQKTGGHYAREAGKTGKASIIYTYKSGTKLVNATVEKIILSKDLTDAAKSSDINTYLDGSTIVLMHKRADTDAAVAAMQLGHRDTAFNIMEQSKINAMSSYEKCMSIVNWLSQVEE